MTRKTETPTADHVSRLVAQWRLETPDVPLDGMEIIARARRLTLLSRPAIEAVFDRYGIDTGQFDVLATLRRSGEPFALRPTELFQALMISSGGLTDRLNRLEKKGLISREASRSDKRSMLVILTQKGRVLIDKAFAEDMAAEETILAPLDKGERKTLAALLAKLLCKIEEDQDVRK